MDMDMRAYLDAMEGRLMARINDSNDRVLERMRGLELSVLGLTEIARGTNMLWGLISSGLTDLSGRVTRLERKE